ncbi:MAG: hypothetical protein AAGD06_32645 [Acidobacteriota bacterium]
MLDIPNTTAQVPARKVDSTSDCMVNAHDLESLSIRVGQVPGSIPGEDRMLLIRRVQIGEGQGFWPRLDRWIVVGGGT